MKYINKKWLFNVMVLTLASFLSNACSDGDNINYEVKLFVNNGIYPINIYISSIHYDRINKSSKITNGKIGFPVASTLPVMKDVQVEFGLKEELLSIYNANHETDYKLLPKVNFSIKNNIAIIQQNKALSVDSIKVEIVNPENVATGDYLIPLGITAVSDNKFLVSSNMANIYILVSVTESYISVQRESFEGLSVLDNRADWDFSAHNASSLKNIVDDNYSTYWYDYYDSGELIVDIKNKVEVNGISLSPTYGWSNYFFMNIELEASGDGTTWTTIDKCTLLSPIGSSENPDIQYIIFKKISLRYLKIVYKDSYGWYPGISELNIYK